MIDISTQKFKDFYEVDLLDKHELLAVDKAVKALKSEGIWAKCRLLYIHCLSSELAAKTNLKQPGEFTLSYPDSVLHIPGTGIVADGEIGSYAETGFNFSSEEDQFFNGSTSISFFCSTPSTSSEISNSWMMGHTGGEHHMGLRVSLSANNVRGRGASNFQRTSGNEDYWNEFQHRVGGISRTNSTEYSVYVGHNLGTVINADEDPQAGNAKPAPDTELQILGSSGSESQTNPVSVSWLGGGLSKDEACRLGYIIEMLTEELTEIQAGRSVFSSQNKGKPVECYVYMPPTYNKDSPIIFTMHGNGRNASGSFDATIACSGRYNAVIVAPRFDSPRFRSSEYHGIGLRNDYEDSDTWTPKAIFRILDDLQTRLRNKNQDCYIVGHSAGGQFVHRMAIFDPGPFKRLVAANSGNYTFLNEDFDYSFGLSDLPSSLRDVSALTDYLARPLTIYIGTEDTNYYWDDPMVSSSEGAVAQGDNRYERAYNMYLTGQALASDLNVPFNWKIVEADGIGHSSRGMFSRAVLDEALDLTPSN